MLQAEYESIWGGGGGHFAADASDGSIWGVGVGLLVVKV